MKRLFLLFLLISCVQTTKPTSVQEDEKLAKQKLIDEAKVRKERDAIDAALLKAHEERRFNQNNPEPEWTREEKEYNKNQPGVLK